MSRAMPGSGFCTCCNPPRAFLKSCHSLRADSSCPALPQATMRLPHTVSVGTKCAAAMVSCTCTACFTALPACLTAPPPLTRCSGHSHSYCKHCVTAWRQLDVWKQGSGVWQAALSASALAALCLSKSTADCAICQDKRYGLGCWHHSAHLHCRINAAGVGEGLEESGVSMFISLYMKHYMSLAGVEPSACLHLQDAAPRDAAQSCL